MTKRIRDRGPTLAPLRDIGPALPRIDAAKVQAALGAEALAEKLDDLLAPLTLYAVREELVRRLQSSGGRPALEGTSRRAKIPLSEEQWVQLEELAAKVSSPGFAPSAGQIASVLLTAALRHVSSE